MTHDLFANRASRAVLAGAGLFAVLWLAPVRWTPPREPDAFQYEFESIAIPAASADEPPLGKLSVSRAVAYLEQGARAWNGSHECVTCHTNGAFMMNRPVLADRLGPPDEAFRRHFVGQLEELLADTPERQQRGLAPAQAVTLAAGFAEWDAHLTGTLSADTERALALMFRLQEDSGTWVSNDCWPPYESSAFHLATVAAMAAGTAPGWLDNLTDDSLRDGVTRLRTYLQEEPPAQDYDRTLLLWAAARLPDLLTAERKQELIDMVFSKQRGDGGWSIRDFSRPEQWGSGNRAEKLRAEPEFLDPPSDGHQTGLAIVVLREAGIPASDPRIRRGIAWLRANQRVSGRWWTRSLNTDEWHFITYSGTALPLRALHACDALAAVAERVPGPAPGR